MFYPFSRIAVWATCLGSLGTTFTVAASPAQAGEISYSVGAERLGKIDALSVEDFSWQPSWLAQAADGQAKKQLSQRIPAAESQQSQQQQQAFAPSPLERPMHRLFGFETGTTLQATELMLHAGGTSFNNPQGQRAVRGGEANRSNDLRFGLDYGITDALQLSLFLTGKDDTIFQNVTGDSSSSSFIYGGLPVQLKWQFLDRERLDSSLVAGFEFPVRTVPSNNLSEFFDDRNARQVAFANFSDVTTSFPANAGALLAKDESIYFSLAAPVSYELSDRARVHLNPQVSFFPEEISVIRTRGNAATLDNTNIGFDHQEQTLDYYGTVAGLGIGADYSLTPKVQLAADVTPILAGQNVADEGGDNSLFAQNIVWNAGVRVAPNPRVAARLFTTNRFGPAAAAPSNLLAQPGGDWGIGLDFTYLPDLTGRYQISVRDSYPEPQAFWSPINGSPSTVLPINSILYQLRTTGSSGQISPALRLGLLDDFEIDLSWSRTEDNENFKREFSGLARLSLIDNTAQNDFSASISAGLLGLAGFTGTNLAFYADLPLSYSPTADTSPSDFGLTVTPRLVVPAQFIGLPNVFAVTAGAHYNITDTTQLMADFTPIIGGDNQFQEGSVAGRGINISGDTPVYTLGVRQLFPAGNSTYALELYWTNSLSDRGLQGVSALPGDESRIGVRFNLLNGTPTPD